MHIIDTIKASIDVKQKILHDADLINSIEEVSQVCIKTFKAGGKVLFCGNGGSAADAQHLAAEFSGRFYYDREPLFSEALHVNTSFLTAVANDYGYEHVYSRLVAAMGKRDDILFGLSTSGNSVNVIKALKKAKELGMITVGMTGLSGGKMKEFSDYFLNIPSDDTPRIQESHIMIGHIICEIVESKIFPK